MAVCLVPVKQGRPIVLDKAIILVGRHPDCDIVISDSPKISRKHCCLAIVNDRPVVRDLGSMNGVFVNGKQIDQQAWLNLHDELKIGNVAYHLKNIGADSQKKKNPNEDQPDGGDDTPTKPPSVQHFKKPKKDVDLSHQFPVAISDSGQNVSVNEMLPGDELDGADDEDDENYSSNHKFEGSSSGSHIEFISS